MQWLADCGGDLVNPVETFMYLKNKIAYICKFVSFCSKFKKKLAGVLCYIISVFYLALQLSEVCSLQVNFFSEKIFYCQLQGTGFHLFDLNKNFSWHSCTYCLAVRLQGTQEASKESCCLLWGYLTIVFFQKMFLYLSHLCCSNTVFPALFLRADSFIFCHHPLDLPLFSQSTAFIFPRHSK